MALNRGKVYLEASCQTKFPWFSCTPPIHWSKSPTLYLDEQLGLLSEHFHYHSVPQTFTDSAHLLLKWEQRANEALPFIQDETHSLCSDPWPVLQCYLRLSFLIPNAKFLPTSPFGLFLIALTSEILSCHRVFVHAGQTALQHVNMASSFPFCKSHYKTSHIQKPLLHHFI